MTSGGAWLIAQDGQRGLGASAPADLADGGPDYAMRAAVTRSSTSS
jgi:hypothetical protein